MVSSRITIGFILARNPIDVNWWTPLAYGSLKDYIYREGYLNSRVEMDYCATWPLTKNYDVIAISSTSQDFGQACRLAAQLKQVNPQQKIILGGQHITYFPELLPPEIDYGIVGEGEVGFLAFVKYLLGELTVNDVPNLVQHTAQGVKGSARAPLLDINTLPIATTENGKCYIFSSRGCPYRCKFCSSSAFWETTRMVSAPTFVRELQQLVERVPGTDPIIFELWDDLFTLNIHRLEAIYKLLRNTGLLKRLHFFASTRVNLVGPYLCNLLKLMNVKGVGLGFESGCTRILIESLGKGITREQSQAALDCLRQYRIGVGGSFIVGIPGETEAEVKQTFDFAYKNIASGKLSSGSAFNILMPMPGTPFWTEACRKGLVDITSPGWSWDRLALFASYRNSKLRRLEDWIRARKRNRSIYLAEETLPEERLYELMLEYEQKILKLTGQLSER